MLSGSIEILYYSVLLFSISDKLYFDVFLLIDALTMVLEYFIGTLECAGEKYLKFRNIVNYYKNNIEKYFLIFNN